jgi:hypothetical protein
MLDLSHDRSRRLFHRRSGLFSRADHPRTAKAPESYEDEHGFGRNTDALRLVREAVEAAPIEKDWFIGTDFLVGLAQIEARAGQPEEAVKLLRQLLTIPAGEFVFVTRLKIDPVWDPIRNDPGF